MAQQHATAPIQHGGNQSSIRARLRLGNRPLLDFSAPLNGLGPPPGVEPAVRQALATIDRYPEPGSPRLVHRLAEAHGVPPDHILVGAGTTELIGLIGQALRAPRPRLAAEDGAGEAPLSHLSEPIYGEYRRTSIICGLRLKLWDRPALGWEQDFFPRGAAGVFWTGHPNNPTARAWDRERLLRYVDESPDLLTIVDEAYLPFLPDEARRSLVRDAVGRDNLLVLRSMTKIYAIAGLRVGYAVAAPPLIARLKDCQQPWTVAATAEAAALAALDDDEYLRRSIDLIAAESIRLTDRLWDVPGLRPAWPERHRPSWASAMPNFVLASLVETPWTSSQVQEALAHRGLFVRECSNYHGLEVGSVLTGPGGQAFETRGHLRFCIRTPRENDLLVSSLAEVLASEPPR